mgnify:CR=1 FL=1
MSVDIRMQRRQRERILLIGWLATGGEARQQQCCALLANNRIVDWAGREPADQLALCRAQAQRRGPFEQALSGICVVA